MDTTPVPKVIKPHAGLNLLSRGGIQNWGPESVNGFRQSPYLPIQFKIIYKSHHR